MLMLLKTRLRLAGLLPIAAMALFAGNAKPPDLIISQSGKAAGMADAQGRLALLYSKRDRFIADIWQKAWPHGGEGDAASLTQSCDKDHCIAVSPNGVRVELVYKPDLLDAACESADILVAPRLRFVDCDGRKPGLIIKRDDFDSKGVHLIRFAGKRSFIVETGIEPDNRPWNLARKPPPYVYKPKAEKPPSAINSDGSDPPADPEPSPVLTENACLVGRVRSLQRDGVSLAAQPLQRRFLFIDQGNDDVACIGAVGLTDDHRVTVENASLDHRVAIHGEGIMAAEADHVRRHHHVMAMLLYRGDRDAGGNPAHDRYRYGDVALVLVAVGGARCRLAREVALDHARREAGAAHGLGRAGNQRGAAWRRERVGQLDDFQRTGTIGQAADENRALQGP